jgi:hypothetical protein
MNRREFLGRGAGIVVAGAALGAMSSRWTDATAAESKANPYAYDVERFGKTDPKLIRYEVAVQFRCASRQPRRIVAGPNDRLYIATAEGICIFSTDGSRVGDLALSAPARCVAVAADGTVFAGLRDHLELFDSKGQRKGAWEAPAGKPWLTGLAVGENSVFAADSASRALLHYDRSGKVLGRIGVKDKTREIPGLIVPSPYLDVDLGRDGLLRLNNPGRHRVEIYTVNGGLELAWGKPSASIEGFCGCCNPIGVALLPDGRTVTCEKGLPRVKVYGADGAFECVVAGTESFPENAKMGSMHDTSDGTMGGLDAAVDTAGRVWVLDLVTGEVRGMARKNT